MTYREKAVVKLLRAIPSDINLLSRPPAIRGYPRSIPGNLAVAIVLITLAIGLFYLLEQRQLRCFTMSNMNPLAALGGMFLLLVTAQTLTCWFRNFGVLRWARNSMLISAGILLFTLVRVACCLPQLSLP